MNIIFTLIYIFVKLTNNSQKCIIFEAIITFQAVFGIIYVYYIINLYKDIYVDDLTGVYNRKFFNKRLYKLKLEGPISLILLDLDNFKSINDKYGHLMGDSVLQQLGEILNLSKRRKDIIIRWGGEEFIIILPETNIEEAYKIGNRIRMLVERFAFHYGDIICKVTVSMGLTSVETTTGIKFEQLLQVTDKALYKAKEKKNFISIYKYN